MKKILFLSLAAMMALAVSCEKDKTLPDDPISVTGVSLDQPSLAIKVGESATLVATVTPEDATNKNVIWASSSDEIATVDNGVVTGKKAGTATITATTVDGDKSAACPVTVSDEDDPQIPVGVGAFFTDDYTSPFKTYLGKTDEDIQKKLDNLWNHYFKGDNNSKVYYDKGTEAYILDTSDYEVKSEGMAYGMMICVQTNHKEEFDKLWKWAKNHMWLKGGDWDGYFGGIRSTSGTGGDDMCRPGAEMYFMASLLFAAHRWDDDQYDKDAQYILDKMWGNPNHKLFNGDYSIITYMPQGNEINFTCPANDLPAFLELFTRWSTDNQDQWKKALSATRTHLYVSSNKLSGLFPEINNFDGTPHAIYYNSNATRYYTEAIRCAMNFGMDYYLFRADDDRQKEMAKRIIDFFEADGYQHASFNWDGSSASEPYTIGQVGCNAVACYALMGEEGYEGIIKKNLQKAWDAVFMTGQYRYYNGMVHFLAMLHLCGSFRIWKPQE